jgi:hypothetical protein
MGSISNIAMPALIGGAIALSPYLVTLGTGLGGLGLAAIGIAAPIEKAAKATGGLRANLHTLTPEQQTVAKGLLSLQGRFHDFEHAVQPQVLGAFSHGLTLAKMGLHDIQPITQATGKAFNNFLGALGRDLNGAEWKNFFAWMAQQAGPDMQLFGKFLISLLNSVPPLLIALQPVAKGLITIATGAADIVKNGAQAIIVMEHMKDALNGNFSAFNTSTKAGKDNVSMWQSLGHGVNTQVQLLTHGIPVISDLGYQLGITASPLGKTASGMSKFGSATKKAVPQLVPFRAGISQLSTKFSNLATAELAALGPLERYASNALQASGDLANLKDALKQSHDKVGLNTAAQRNSFSTAQQYISDLQKQASSALSSGKGAKSAATNIANGLPTLAAAAKSNKTLRQEVNLLTQALANLRKEHAIHTAITVSGTGHWSVAKTQGENGSRVGPTGLGYATGGLVNGPGSGTSDSVLARLSKGELVVPAKMVNAGLADSLRGMLPGFANGGIVGAYKGGAGGLTPWTKDNFSATVNSITSSIAGSLAKSFQGFVSRQIAGSFGGGVTRWTSTVVEALKMLHLPLSDLSLVLHQMQTESGGNPNAINLTDSNAQHGDPSRGLMQTIGGTFSSFHVPGTSNNIYNPLANIAAALNYAIHTPGVGIGSSPGQLGGGTGYDAGGIARGMGWMAKKTIKPERVLNPAQTSAFERMVDALDSRSAAREGGRQFTIKGGTVDLDVSKSKLAIRHLAVEESRAEIEFALNRR